MKRIICCVIAIIMLTGLYGAGCGAASGFSLTVGNGFGSPGNVVKINVNIDINPGIAGFTLVLSYNKNALKLTGIETDNNWSGMVLPQADDNGVYANPSLFSYASTTDKFNTGKLMTLSFTVIDGIEPCEEMISAAFVVLCDQNGNDVSYSVSNGKAIIVPGEISLKPGSEYRIDTQKKQINGVGEKTTVAYFISGFNTEGVFIRSASGSILGDGDDVGTGCRVCVAGAAGEISYTVIVPGDVSGDGSLDVIDCLLLKAHLTGKKSLSDEYKDAGAAIGGSADINLISYIRAKGHVFGLFDAYS